MFSPDFWTCQIDFKNPDLDPGKKQMETIVKIRLAGLWRVLIVFYAGVSIGIPTVLLAERPPARNCEALKKNYQIDATNWYTAERCDWDTSSTYELAHRCLKGREVQRVDAYDYPRCASILETTEIVLFTPLIAFAAIFGAGFIVRWVYRGFRESTV